VNIIVVELAITHNDGIRVTDIVGTNLLAATDTSQTVLDDAVLYPGGNGQVQGNSTGSSA
jgi:hypothetical protein